MRKFYQLRKAMAVALMAAITTGCGSTAAGSAAGTQTAQNAANGASQVVANENNIVSSNGVVTPAEQIVLNNDLPDDYNDMIRTTIQKVDMVSTEQTVNYIFITDLHMDDARGTLEAMQRELKSVVELANADDSIDFVCVGGDLYNGRCEDKKDALAYVRSVSEALSTCTKPVFILKGNHDDNSFSAQVNLDWLYDPAHIINNDEWYANTMSYFSQYAAGYQDGYFYYDLPNKNTRVVCLNMSDSDQTIENGLRKEMGMYFYGYSDKQMNWLLNDAFSRTDCQYVILSHDAFDYPEGYGNGNNRDTLQTILAAAMQKTAFANGTFAKDFSAWNSQILVYNSGHLHMERLIQDPLAGNLPVLNTETAQVQNFNVWIKNKGYLKSQDRTLDTLTESNYDVVVASPNRINVLKFGSGEDYGVDILR